MLCGFNSSRKGKIDLYMNILFCGSLLPSNYEGKYKGLSAAGNQFQNNLLKAMKQENTVKTIAFINYPVNGESVEIRKAAEAEEIECFFTEDSKAAVLQFRGKMREYAEWADLAIVYNMMYPWYGIGSYMKRLAKKSIVIIADYTNWKEYKSLPRKAYALLNALEFRKYGKVVMLSQGMKKYIKSNQQVSVINGCINWDKFKDIKAPELKGTVNILYTGGLSTITGASIMLEAFEEIQDSNINLIITGQGGNLQNMTMKLAEQDRRIKYRGFVSREEYYELLENAHIFLSPRNMHFEQNTANFPSKVLEYLAAGRYVVSTKFMGYEVYRDYFIFTESDAKSFGCGMKQAIEQVRQDCKAHYVLNRDYARKLDWSVRVADFLDYNESEV